MSVQTEIDRIITAVHAAHEKVKEKGGTTSEPYLVANLEGAIGSIPEASDPTLQSKTVSPATSQQVVTPDSGYDGLSSVIVNAMPTATQATPSISVSADGLITASATQSAGYVSAGTKSATKQLDVQGAQTITPAAADQTIAAGKYLTGAQTIKGDSNLAAENIKSGVSIFGVAGTHEGGVTAPKTYTLTASYSVDFSIEVVRYYGADGTPHDFVSKVTTAKSFQFSSPAGGKYTMSSVVNADGYTGTVTSGIIQTGDYSYYDDSGECGGYKMWLSIDNGTVTLELHDANHPNSEMDGFMYGPLVSIIDYDIVTSG